MQPGSLGVPWDGVWTWGQCPLSLCIFSVALSSYTGFCKYRHVNSRGMLPPYLCLCVDVFCYSSFIVTIFYPSLSVVVENFQFSNYLSTCYLEGVRVVHFKVWFTACIFCSFAVIIIFPYLYFWFCVKYLCLAA